MEFNHGRKVHSVHHRQQESLYHALGPLIADALARPDVVEIMANPDSSLWVDRAGVGRELIGRIGPRVAYIGRPAMVADRTRIFA
jgi:Flp pilus assembly CpaF family ATPase